MPPKKNTVEVVEEVTMKDLLTELTAIRQKLEKVEGLETKIDQLTTKLDAMNAENIKLKQTIEELQVGLDAVERHQRSWSVRVLNIPLTTEEERDPRHTMEKVYSVLFQPILEGARESGEIREVPSCEQLLETAHVLPGRPGSSKPVIVRFTKRGFKSLCFRYRKNYAPTACARGDPDRERQSYPFFDDLTRTAAHKLAEIKASDRVQSAWTINGQIRYKLKDSNTVKKVKSVFDSLETILSFT